MEASKSPFKKKQIFNFYDNGNMNSSMRPFGSSIIQDEKFLAMQKQLKKLKKTHNELAQQYEKMKNISIVQKVGIQMELYKANEKLRHLTEENGMLMAKISHLEKEGQTRTKSYQRQLGRSTNKSVSEMNKSYCHNDEIMNQKTIRLGTESCLPKEKESKNQLMTSRSNNIESLSSCSISQSRFTQNDGSCFKIKFNPQISKQKPLISEENQEPDFCCKQRCIQNYKELQYLREAVSFYGQEMDQICMQLKFALDRKTELKDIAEYKLEILKLCEENTGKDFFYKTKPEKMMKKIQEKAQQILKNPKRELKNPQLQQIKQKINRIKKSKEELEKEWVSESFDDEAGKMEIEKIQQSQKELFEKVRETLNFKSKKENLSQMANGLNSDDQIKKEKLSKRL